MPNYKSDSVNVFPTAYRTLNTAGRFTSETNFSNILKTLIYNKISKKSTSNKYVDGFVVGFLPSKPSTLAVVIAGYYLEVDGFSTGTTPPANTVLYIRVSGGYLVNVDSGTTDLDETTGGTSYFKGLGSTTTDHIPSQPSDGSVIYLLQVTDSSGKLMNQGFIPDLMLDSNGNWIPLKDIIKIKDGDIKIDASKLYADSPVYVANLFVEGARKLVDANNKGISMGGDTKPVKFKDGLPALLGSVGGTNQPIGLDKGELKTISGDIGRHNHTSKSVIVSKGKLVEGLTTVVSDKAPTTTAGYSNGDLWFVVKS